MKSSQTTTEHAGPADRRRIELGRIVGIHGLQGWLKIQSYTDPREAVLDYRPLQIGDETFEEFEGKAHGRGLLLRLSGREDRTAVEDLVGKSITISRAQLPEPGHGEYYHVDLIGLQVVNATGDAYGRVERVMRTGANDVLVVAGDRQRLIPFAVGRTVASVDLDQGRVVVNWEADWL